MNIVTTASTFKALAAGASTVELATAFCQAWAQQPEVLAAWVGTPGGDGPWARVGPEDLFTDWATSESLFGAEDGPVAAQLVSSKGAYLELQSPQLSRWRETLQQQACAALLVCPLGSGSACAVIFCREALAGGESLADQLQQELNWAFQRQAILSQQSLVAAAAEDAANSMFLTDALGNIVWTNHAFENLTGYTRAEVLGRNPRLLKSGRQGARYYKRLWQALAAGQVWTAEAVDKDKHGFIYAINQTISPIRHSDEQRYFLSVHEDVSQRRVLRQEHDREHPVEEQTGLLNPTAFRAQIAEAVATADATGRGGFVVSLALENFVTATRVLGAETSAEVLKALGERVRSILNADDAASYEGDGNFGLLFSGVTAAREVEARMRGLLQALAAPIGAMAERYYFSPRYGLAAFPAQSTHSDELWRLADDAILEASE